MTTSSSVKSGTVASCGSSPRRASTTRAKSSAPSASSRWRSREPPSWTISSMSGCSRRNPAKHRREQPGAEARRGAEPHPAPVQVQHLADPATGGVGVGQHPSGHRQQRLAGVGQRDVAPGPVEQGSAELSFERPHLLGQGRLCHPHLVGRPGEVPGVGHGHEVGELLQLHLSIIANTIEMRVIMSLTSGEPGFRVAHMAFDLRPAPTDQNRSGHPVRGASPPSAAWRAFGPPPSGRRRSWP